MSFCRPCWAGPAAPRRCGGLRRQSLRGHRWTLMRAVAASTATRWALTRAGAKSDALLDSGSWCACAGGGRRAGRGTASPKHLTAACLYRRQSGSVPGGLAEARRGASQNGTSEAQLVRQRSHAAADPEAGRLQQQQQQHHHHQHLQRAQQHPQQQVRPAAVEEDAAHQRAQRQGWRLELQGPLRRRSCPQPCWRSVQATDVPVCAGAGARACACPGQGRGGAAQEACARP